jgi:adenylate cyclase
VFLADDETARVLAERAREQEEAERRRVRDLFGRYVADTVVEQLLADPSQAKLGGVRREVSVIFADIRGYTTISERSTPEELVAILSRYLTLAVDTVREQRGTLDKFLGDGVMAVWGAPLDQPDHALAAVRAAWQLQQRAAGQLEGVSFGVGVNTGEAIVGNIGTEEFRNYSCVGDVVNVASRMQGQAPGGSVYLTASTLERVKEHVKVEPLGPMELKGHTPVEVFRLLEVAG